MGRYILFSTLAAATIFCSATPLPQLPGAPALGAISGVTSGVGVDPSNLHLTGRQVIHNADYASSSAPNVPASNQTSAAKRDLSMSSIVEKRVELGNLPINSLPVVSGLMQNLPTGRKRDAEEEDDDMLTKGDGEEQAQSITPETVDKRQLQMIEGIVGAIGKGQKPKNFRKPFDGHSPVPGLAGRADVAGQGLPSLPLVGNAQLAEGLLPLSALSSGLSAAGGKAKGFADATKKSTKFGQR